MDFDRGDFGGADISQSVSQSREGGRENESEGGWIRNAKCNFLPRSMRARSAICRRRRRHRSNFAKHPLPFSPLPSSPRPCLTLARRRPPSGSEQKQGFPTALPFLKDLDVTIRIRGSQQFPFLAKSRISRFLRWSLGSPAPTSASFSAEFIICYVPEESRNPAENICCAFTVREPKQN